MRILVTGSAGFIASNLVDYFDGQHELVGMDSRLIGDVTDIDDCMEMARDVDCIVHLAALPGVQQSFDNPMQCIRTNAFGTVNVLEAAIANNVRTVVIASSNAANDKDSSPYAWSKWMSEYIAQLAPIDTVVLRFSNVYGPHSKHKKSLIHAGIKALQNGQIVDVYGTGLNERDFIHVNDVCRAIELAIMSEYQHSCPIEIGTGKATSVLDALSELMLVADKPLQINYKPALQEQTSVVANTVRAYHELRFTAQIPLRDGLRMTLEAC